MLNICTVLDRMEGFIESFDHDIVALPRNPRAQATIQNLTTHRWCDPIPSAAEEAELVRRAQAGCKRAAERLVVTFHRLILAIAGRRGVNYGRYRGDVLHANELRTISLPPACWRVGSACSASIRAAAACPATPDAPLWARSAMQQPNTARAGLDQAVVSAAGCLLITTPPPNRYWRRNQS